MLGLAGLLLAELGFFPLAPSGLALIAVLLPSVLGRAGPALCPFGCETSGRNLLISGKDMSRYWLALPEAKVCLLGAPASAARSFFWPFK